MPEAIDALRKAEVIDGYRKACESCSLNSAARSNQIYAPSFLEVGQLIRVSDAISKVPLASTCDIVVLHPSADNGYPHTRPNSLICMPASFVGSSTSKNLEETILHEAIHIHQRRNPKLWESACRKEGWTPISAEQIPPEFTSRCRLNPDTMSKPFWAWQTNSVPLPLFTREDYPTMEGVQIKWFDIRTNAVITDPPPSFTARYGSPSQPEHPYEILAVEYAAAKLNTDELLKRKLESI